MKRILCLLLCGVMLFSLLPARAEEKDPVSRIEIDVTLPMPGELPGEPVVKVTARKNGEEKLLTSADYMPDHAWREETSKNGDSHAFTGAFVNGKLYKLTITLADILTGYEINDTTKLMVNGGESQILSALSIKEGGKDALITLHFRAAPGEITPAVSVSADGKAERDYNGEDLVLEAAVTNIMDGVSYNYQWYKDGGAIAGAEEKTYSVRNVWDSGVYVCRVTAYATGETKSTDSLELTVNITPHPVTLVMEDAEKNSDERDPELTYTVLGDAYDPLTGTPVREEGEAQGRYEIDVGTVAFADDVADNYTVTVRKGHFTIVGTGVQTFAALADVADLSYLVGKNGSHVRVSSTKEALPDGAILTLDTVDEKAMGTLTASAGKKGVMKSLTISMTPGPDGRTEMNKNSILRLMIPLSEEEERYDGTTIKALFLDSAGAVQNLTIRREADEQTGVVYLVTEVRSLGTIAVLEGELLPEEEEEPEAEEKGETPRHGATWLWVLIGIFTAAAAGVIVWALIRAGKGEALLPSKEDREEDVIPEAEEEPEEDVTLYEPPSSEDVKIYEPKMKTNATPEMPDGAFEIPDMPTDVLTDLDVGEKVEPPPVAGRVVSFDDLDDEP